MARFRHSEEYPRPAELTKWGFPASFYAGTVLRTVPAEHAAEPPIPTPQECLARFRANHDDYIEEYHEGKKTDKWYTPIEWDGAYRHFPYEMLADTFTFEELLRIQWRDCIMSSISEEVDRNPAYMLFRKIRSSMWHWGWKDDWNLFVRAFNAIKAFDFGVEGFETYIDHASWHNEYGYCQWSRQYCDGSLCFNIVYKGELVLRIGYSISKDGVMLTQVQTCKKKGNRWLYKLPRHYFDHCVHQMRKAFRGFKLWLVDGDSMADYILRGYDKMPATVERPTPEVLDRIRGIYDEQIDGFVRGVQTVNYYRRIFHRLVRRRNCCEEVREVQAAEGEPEGRAARRTQAGGGVVLAS